MSDKAPNVTPPTAAAGTTPSTTTTTPPPAGGPNTRSQQQKKNDDATSLDDNDKSTDTSNKKPPADKFKGNFDKMEGHVFQLAEEGRKGNQYTQTLEALKNYAMIELEYASDLSSLFDTPCTAPDLSRPTDEPPMSSDKVNRVPVSHFLYLEWKDECTDYVKRRRFLATNLSKLFTVIMLQCSQSVKNKIKSTVGHTQAKSDYDCKWLITTLQGICHRFEHTENRFLALIEAKSAIFNCRQHANQSVADYFEAFSELVDILEQYGGKVHDPETSAPSSLTDDSDEYKLLPLDERDSFLRDRYLGALLIRNADPHRFNALKLSLFNAFADNQDLYPTSLTAAHQRLLRYKSAPAAHSPNTSRPPRSETSRDNSRGNRGRSGGRTGRNFVQVSFSLTQVDDHFPDGIPTNFILLDSDSTVSIFCNPHLLTDIHTVPEPLHLATNGGGHQVTHQMGYLPDFGAVWYNPDSIANVLSLAQVRLTRRVTMDTAITPAFLVHKLTGPGYTIFAEHPSGLYLHDACSPPSPVPAAAVAAATAPMDPAPVTITPIVPHDNTLKSTVNDYSYSFLQTVATNKMKFTNRQIEAADAARTLYRLIGRPSYPRFLQILNENHINNCPITADDACCAESIYGRDVAFLKGKTTARPAKAHVSDYNAIALPPNFLSIHPNVTLCCDLFYVLGLGFSLSTSRNIRYLSCHPLTDRTKESIRSSLAADIALYTNRGFTTTDIHADGEYNVFPPLFPAVHFSICSADDHVPEIERAIRTVKETVRSTIHGMPYSRLPRVLVKELVTHAITSLNMLPSPDGISTTLSPAAIVLGTPKPDYRTLKLEFGTYVQVYDGTSNDTKSRTLGAIATNPTGNSSGDYFFMSLSTGQRIHRRSWTILPISDSAISRVETIALNEGMPPVDTDHMISEYDPDAILDDSAYDRNYLPPPTPDSPSDHDLTSDAYTSESDSEDDDSDDDNGHLDSYDSEPAVLLPVPVPPPVPVPEERTVQPVLTPPIVENEERNDILENEERHTIMEIEERNEILENEERHTIVNNEERTEILENEERPILETEHDTSTSSRTKGLRPKKAANFKYRYGFTQTDTKHQTWSTTQQAIADMTPPPLDRGIFSPQQFQHVQKAITGLMFTQMSAHKGIKKHGQLALDALRKEFIQFRALDVLEPLDAFTLTDEQKAESLRALSVIKEKRDGTLKGRTCADGSKQQGKFSKAETGSPTIANDALFLSIMIDAHEKRDVATADIAGAYLHAHMKDFITMRFVGWAVNLLCDVNPEYSQHVVYEGKVKVLYVRCNKAIYGCVVSGVLWYELFSTSLVNHGFTTNPYDFCVANATIDGSQCTIGWFVDDTKISHSKPAVVTKIINLLEKQFGEMKVTRGPTHKFLGMNIKYLGDGTATIHMPSYIEEAIAESGLPISRPAPSPCASTLLFVDPDSPLLPMTRARIFHSVVAKLIYVGTRSRTDILLALRSYAAVLPSPQNRMNQNYAGYLNTFLKPSI